MAELNDNRLGEALPEWGVRFEHDPDTVLLEESEASARSEAKMWGGIVIKRLTYTYSTPWVDEVDTGAAGV